MKVRGWSQVDVILISGDAYVDHPSYGAAVIGRMLESQGYKVGIIAQPDWRKIDDFRKLGPPRLFFGITAGNLDSMVANYTANRNKRKDDEYSPAGKAGMRPERAVIVYSNRAKEAFADTPIIIGGLEASMRRLAHYDYWSDTVRRSVLIDSKADILIYGMGERQILEIASSIAEGKDIKSLSIAGTVVSRKDIGGIENYQFIPSFEDVAADKEKFNQAFKHIYQENDPYRGKVIAQAHDKRLVIQFPPALPFKVKELDNIYELPYQRIWHPVYDKLGGIPGFETVRNSVVSHRGCSGECSFCSLFFHQGRIIQNRSMESIVDEVKKIAAAKGFHGTITDIGGPTVNLYGAECENWIEKGACLDKKCLFPKKCHNLKIEYKKMMRVWKECGRIPKLKHVFVGSGLRYDLLIEKDAKEYLNELCKSHISGQLKVAPEHACSQVLDLMGKPGFDVYEKFVKEYKEVNRALGKNQHLVNYFISGHPGSGLKETLELALYLVKHKIKPEQIQDYIPLPMTLSGTIYYSGKHPFTGKEVYVAKGFKERQMQRAMLQYYQPNNLPLVREALKILGKENLLKVFLGS
jgi:uncharacterized radical SAM protein YgiQ